ncbi:MAG TPA: ATP-binding cassette domain-containing protein, partial [Thermoplasmata archaeon]|nr:ATP-binding cassette domain-containing protein [Thermoplasmata archaeon]
GKTTTVSVLTTLLRPTRGRAEVAGLDVVESPAAVRKRIGIVFQRSTADADLTGRENLELAAGLYGLSRIEARPRIREVLERMELADAADRPVRSYSGGMQRRLEVAVGTIHRPEVLFLDEPTLGLDPQSRAGFWEYIRSLRAEEEVTVFLTTHYLDEADQLCDRISVIDRGRIIASGTPSELKERMGGDVVEVTVVDGAEDRSPLFEQLSGVTAVAREGSLYRLRCPRGESLVTKVALAAHDANVEVGGILVRKPSLDDVFLRMTGRAYREEGESNGSNHRGPTPEEGHR